jgi:hypothetical protein
LGERYIQQLGSNTIAALQQDVSGFDPLEYQYVSSDARKKSASNLGSVKSDDSTLEKKEPIAA